MTWHHHGVSHPLSRDNLKLQAGLEVSASGDTFVLGGVIGDGAVGVVRKAERKRDGQKVAIKFLAPDPKYIEEGVFDDVASRFRKEGEKGARLEHEHLVKIIASGGHSDVAPSAVPNPFLVMELLKGKTLESYIRRTAENERGKFLIIEPKLRIAIQIVRALEYLHSHRLVHRDVKPANIFMTDKHGENIGVQVGDFGVMKWGDFHSSIATGMLTTTHHPGLGTIKYMPPEQAIRPKDVSTKSDIYPLGATLFELFTGQILAGVHNVYELGFARLQRGTTQSRYQLLAVPIPSADEAIGTLILDMVLRGVDGRPTAKKVLGMLEYEYERRFVETAES